MLSENSAREKLTKLNISMKGKYINDSLSVKLKCNVCNFQWLGSVKTIIKKGCPRCQTQSHNSY